LDEGIVRPIKKFIECNDSFKCNVNLLLKWGYQHKCYPPAEWFGKSHEWVNLSNSGDTLKLIIPSSYIRSGWSNDSYPFWARAPIGREAMVINYKMSENEIGNRGSKCFGWPSSLLRKAGGKDKTKRATNGW
jgi:hypothetical protein